MGLVASYPVYVVLGPVRLTDAKTAVDCRRRTGLPAVGIGFTVRRGGFLSVVIGTLRIPGMACRFAFRVVTGILALTEECGGDIRSRTWEGASKVLSYLRYAVAVLLTVAFCGGRPSLGQPRPGDTNADAHVDLVDVARSQVCFTGPNSDPNFQPPDDPECLILFDSDGDGDFDLDDFDLLRCAIGGPSVSLPAVIVDAPASPTRSTILKISGTTAGWPSVTITGAKETVVASVNDCTFAATVELQKNRVNRLFLTGVLGDATTSTPTPLTIVHDEQPPTLFIDLPSADAEIAADTTDVAGRVGDMLSGFAGLQVFVNGRTAEVDIGIGTNGTFFLPGLRLNQDGATPIEAVGRDALGNTAIIRIDVTRVAIAADEPRMEIVSGNRQTAQIASVLPDPIVVRVVDSKGAAFANKIVTFDVTRSNGRLTADGSSDGSMMLQVRTDANGEARAFWQLGFDAGCGNNRVEVTSRDIAGTTVFCASGTPAPPAQINIGSGNNQRAEAGGPAPEPLRVWVSDACNGVQGVPVTFAVTDGGGLVNGQAEVTLLTSDTGHAEVDFTLGTEPGNNRVEASFPANPTNAARFVVFGVRRDESRPTSFSGLVLNNNDQPIQGATCTLTVGGVTEPPVQSDINGLFRFDKLPGAGPADLHIDGLTAFHVGGAGGTDVPAGSYPALHFEPILIPNADNTLSTPVLLPPLNPANARVFDNTQDVELTIEGIDLLRMIVKAGSMTRADASVPSSADPAVIALNQVFFDKVPMPMPDGAAPPFAWTLQPAGARFDPPVEIIYPNMSALPPGSIAYFLSFNHDTMRFEIVATGSVTDDGLCIVSDPGAGISTAGWGCNCPPYSVTGDCCDCNDCEECQDGDCVPIVCTGCRRCQGGSCVSGCGECRNCVGGGCVLVSGGACNDGDLCTTSDHCTPGGACVGTRITCGQCQSCVNGTCESDDGAACALPNDQGQCIEGQCQNGQCVETLDVAGGGSNLCACEAGAFCIAVGATCCGDVCCEPGSACCNSELGSCCPPGDQCCEGSCCTPPATCCNNGQGTCCKPEEICCGDVCCPAGGTCGDAVLDRCCPFGRAFCEGRCCPEDTTCCNNGESTCCFEGDSCCGENCCPPGRKCCNAKFGVCCFSSDSCCDGQACCSDGTTCCANGTGLCCPEGLTCCEDRCCNPFLCEVCDGTGSCVQQTCGECEKCTAGDCQPCDPVCEVCQNGECVCVTPDGMPCDANSCEVCINFVLRAYPRNSPDA